MASYQEQLHYLLKNGVARSNRFQVIIPLPAGVGGSTRTLDIMMESTDIPGKNLTTSDVKYNGDFYKIPYYNVYEIQSFLFRCSRDMIEKAIIDQWMSIIFNPRTHSVGYMDDYAVNITLNQLNEQDQIVYSVVLEDAYPMMCMPMNLSNEDRDNYVRLATQFSYRRWRLADEFNRQTEATDDQFGRIREIVNIASGASRGVDSLSQTPLGTILTPVLSNPAVQRALEVFKSNTGIDLEGEAVNIYNQIDSILQGTTGQSINKIASLIEAIRAQTQSSGRVSNNQKAILIEIIDDVLRGLRS